MRINFDLAWYVMRSIKTVIINTQMRHNLHQYLIAKSITIHREVHRTVNNSFCFYSRLLSKTCQTSSMSAEVVSNGSILQIADWKSPHNLLMSLAITLATFCDMGSSEQPQFTPLGHVLLWHELQVGHHLWLPLPSNLHPHNMSVCVIVNELAIVNGNQFS